MGVPGVIETGGAEFAGDYNGAPVLADCAQMSERSVFSGRRWSVKCVVSVAGERAAAFVLVP